MNTAVGSTRVFHVERWTHPGTPPASPSVTLRTVPESTLRLLPPLLALLLPARAGATTVAVLPLSSGGDAGELAGLGQALSAMIVTDLAGLEGLTLVERARISALLAEVELGESAYIDPATAQELGHGVAADALLVGEWVVADGTLAVSTRLVDVEEAVVLASASADGPLAEFAAVEKDCVEQLLPSLQVHLTSSDRRRLYLASPTEDVSALSAWGEGLSSEQSGDLEAARDAYARAIAYDPRFNVARDSLVGLTAQLEAARSAHHAHAAQDLLASRTRILEELPPGLPDPGDAAGTVDLALRLVALEDLNRPCERYQLMWDYLDHVGWQVEAPRREDGAVFSYVLRQATEARQLAALPGNTPGSHRSNHPPASRTGPLFTDTAAFVLGGSLQRLADYDHSAMIASMTRCFGPEERLGELSRMAAAVRAHGAGASLRPYQAERFLPIDETLLLTRAFEEARLHGATPEVSAILGELTAAHPPDDPRRSTLEARMDRVLREASEWETAYIRRLGWSRDELRRLGRGVVDEDPSVLVPIEACATLRGYTLQVLEMSLAADRQEPPGVRSYAAIDNLGLHLGVLRDLGCLVGEDARFSSPGDVLALTSELDRWLRPGWEDDPMCVQGASQFRTTVTPETRAQARSWPGGEPTWAWQALSIWYGNLVIPRCVELP